MSKSKNRFLILGLIFVLTLVLVLFVGCGEDEPKYNTISLTNITVETGTIAKVNINNVEQVYIDNGNGGSSTSGSYTDKIDYVFQKDTQAVVHIVLKEGYDIGTIKVCLNNEMYSFVKDNGTINSYSYTISKIEQDYVCTISGEATIKKTSIDFDFVTNNFTKGNNLQVMFKINDLTTKYNGSYFGFKNQISVFENQEFNYNDKLSISFWSTDSDVDFVSSTFVNSLGYNGTLPGAGYASESYDVEDKKTTFVIYVVDDITKITIYEDDMYLRESSNVSICFFLSQNHTQTIKDYVLKLDGVQNNYPTFDEIKNATTLSIELNLNQDELSWIQDGNSKLVINNKDVAESEYSIVDDTLIIQLKKPYEYNNSVNFASMYNIAVVQNNII